jgi:CBS domain-containing protein
MLAGLERRQGDHLMKASDVMVAPVVTVRAGATLKEVARLLLKKRISAVPVVDERDRLVGIVSEGDLIQRAEISGERRRSRWLAVLAGDQVLAADFIKAHATKVADVMTRKVITADPDTPLHELATLMERHAVKRVPILRNAKLVGIVSRANLMQAIATTDTKLEIPQSDEAIRETLMTRLHQQPWAHAARLNATVSAGVANLWGVAGSDTERTAIRVAAETTPGVLAVNDHIVVGPLGAS